MTTLVGPTTLPLDRAITLYREMLKIRMVEEEIARQYGRQKMRCPTHLCIGQEAPAVAIAAHLRQEDRVLSNHRAHAHYLAKGGDLSAMIAELHGKATGCSKGVGGSMHLTDLSVNFMASTPVVGGTIPVAAGVAFGDQQEGNSRVTVGFFGDAATEEGIWSETLNFAALHKLPLVMVCENNLYSTQSSMDVRQAEGRNRAAIAEAHGVTALSADGNRIDSLYGIAGDAVARAREGMGPTYLDLQTYRWLEHCGPLDDTSLGYRTTQEVAAWKARCPLAHWKEALGLDDSLLREELQEEIDCAFAQAEKDPYPKSNTLHHHVYAH